MRADEINDDEHKREALAKLTQIRDACDDDWLRTLPLLGLQNNRLVQDRTGVLLAVAESHFVVTAAHDLQQLARAEIPLYVPATTPDQPAIQLKGHIHGAEENQIDLAIVELDAETAETLRLAGKRFLRVTDTDPDARPVPGYYVVRGYPLDLAGRGLCYSAALHTGNWPTDSDYPCNPTYHLLLEHSKAGFGDEGQPVTSPRIQGMSGCGIWRLTTKPPNSLTDWSPEERKLVAIQTKYKRGTFMKGTWIRYAFTLIADRCPRLRPAMATLYLPPSNR